MTLITTLVLQAIARGYRFGFDIVDVTGCPTGTVYPALRRLERAGCVRSEWERQRVAVRDARPQRRYYEITAAGRTALQQALEPVRALGGLRSIAPKGAK
ncbi:MAG TPA: helix-turn-helix transcriptional regulator [Vicinamibacterales bacterium]|nr:helix-turn-helix transcriptional regulator [Vicinamibacterales bacterium]